MEADQLAAGAAVVAVIVSIAAVIVTVLLHNSAQNAQRVWELDQDRKRHSWSKDLQDRQNEWQKERDNELRDWEQSLQNPKLEVRLDIGLEVVRGEGVVATWINVVCTNVGFVQVFMQEFGLLVMPDDRRISLADLLHTSKVRIDFDPKVALQSGDSVTASWLLPYTREQLKKVGYTNSIEFRGRYSDKLGNFYDSPPYIIDLDDDRNIIIPADTRPVP